MSWSVGTRASFVGHIRALGALAAAQPSLGREKLLARYIRSIFAKGQSKPHMRAGISVVRALEDMGWIHKVVQRKHWRMAKSTASETEEQRPYGGLEALAVLAQ